MSNIMTISRGHGAGVGAFHSLNDAVPFGSIAQLDPSSDVGLP